LVDRNTLLKLPVAHLVAFALGLPVVACGHTAPRTAVNSREVQAKPVDLELEQLVITQTDADNIAKIHARGMQRLQNGDFQGAERDFDLCVRAAPNGPHAASALYHGGLALDELGRFDLALQRLLLATERLGDQPLGQAAALRAVRIACHLERWGIAKAEAEQLLAKKVALRPFDVILVQGALAMEAVMRDDDIAAEQHVARARNALENNGLDAPGKISRDVAAVYFALGEVRRLRATRIGLVPPPPNFGVVLEQRCELILAAQSAYSDAMRAYDAHWSTMAGYRIGELYVALHEELMRIVPPESVTDPHQRQLFEGAMRLRYSVLVQKALNMMKHTLTMAERTGEKSEWVERTKQAEQDLAQRLVQEEAAIDRLPYSRQALEFALLRLQAAAVGKGK